MIAQTGKDQKRTRGVVTMEEANLHYRILVDANIVSTVACGEDVLDLEPLRHHLVTYADYWLSSEPKRHAANSDSFVESGCMVCGRVPVHLFVMTAEGAGILPEGSSLWGALRSRVDCGGEGSFSRMSGWWLPLLNVHQALWRLSPRSYFESIPALPLLYMPVLLLCDECSVLARRTHREIEFENIKRGALTPRQLSAALLTFLRRYAGIAVDYDSKPGFSATLDTESEWVIADQEIDKIHLDLFAYKLGVTEGCKSPSEDEPLNLQPFWDWYREFIDNLLIIR